MDHLYLHVPFCDGKCLYCGFYSVVADADAHRLFAPLPGRELAQRLAGAPAPAPLTLYIGGGTPGVLGPDAFTRLAESLLAVLKTDRLLEWSVELAPATVTADLLAALRHAGVNRVSIGVQSFDDDALRRVGRRHDAACAVRAVDRLRQAGIDNWGLDLIAGLPGVTSTAWRATLRRAAALEPAHVSVYALGVEPGTSLARQVEAGLALPDAEAQLAALNEAEEQLARAGLLRYEISNYARPGRACRHNLACWRGMDYLGLGPGAASRCGRLRRTNRPDWAAYADAVERGAPPPAEEERLTAAEDAAERFVFGLRLATGVSPRGFARLWPAAAPRVDEWEHTLDRHEAPGIVTRTGRRLPRWTLTSRGREVADALIRELL